ncbi:MAG: hypothetical protein H7338_11740, partial [Candidatus Sericytochromatia bacterium]|nr:hypothetical protein [Candidatus Sericytochromatia bacterium]
MSQFPAHHAANGVIRVRGAKAHNLKDVSLTIPRQALVVFTGVSGSGKSSLAFDTIFAEGQRRYVESLSTYARQFLGQLEKPDVESIEGLSPAIAIDQKSASHNPRSTVGTVTEIYDYLRLLYARMGQPHCPNCRKAVNPQSVDQIVDAVLELPEGTKFQVLAPVIRGRKGEYREVLVQARTEGFARARIDGKVVDLADDIVLDKRYKHDIAIVVDRLVRRGEMRSRLADSLGTALQKAGGLRVTSWPLPMPGIGPQIAMWFWLVPISVLGVAFIAWRAQKRHPLDRRTQTLAIAAAFSVGLISQALQRPDTAHLSWVTCISFALVPVALIELLRLVPTLRIGPAVLRPFAAMAPIVLILFVIIPFYPLRTYGDLVGQTFGRNVFGFPIERGDRVFYYGSKGAAAAAQAVVDALDEQSEVGQSLIVGPTDLSKTPYSDAFFYYLFPELDPGTRFIEMDPGIADAPGSGLAQDLEHADWLIQSDVWSGWVEPNTSVDAG